MTVIPFLSNYLKLPFSSWPMNSCSMSITVKLSEHLLVVWSFWALISHKVLQVGPTDNQSPDEANSRDIQGSKSPPQLLRKPRLALVWWKLLVNIDTCSSSPYLCSWSRGCCNPRKSSDNRAHSLWPWLQPSPGICRNTPNKHICTQSHPQALRPARPQTLWCSLLGVGEKDVSKSFQPVLHEWNSLENVRNIDVSTTSHRKWVQRYIFIDILIFSPSKRN